jgi:poly(3-hydroxybutyrate) depolymerase
MSWRIAAFAPVSGAFYINTTTCDPSTVAIPCNNSRPILMIEFHGANDTTIAYEGGLRKNECLPSIPHFIQEWAVRDGLSLVNTTTNLTRDTLLYSYGKGIEEGLVTHAFDTDIGHD